MAIKRDDRAADQEETRALAREVGRRSVGQFETSLARIASDSGALGRWLLSALVLLNGGGIAVAASLAGRMAPLTAAPALILFVFGAALAVIGALVSLASGLVLARRIGEASGHWAQVAATGEIGDAALAAAGRVRRQSLLWSLAALAVSLVSLLLFMTGAMTVADGVAAPAQPAALSPAEAALAEKTQGAVNASAAEPQPAPMPPAAGPAQPEVPVPTP